MRGFDRASKELALLRAAVQGGGDGDVSVEGGGPKCRLFRIVMFKNKKNYSAAAGDMHGPMPWMRSQALGGKAGRADVARRRSG